MVTSFKRPHSLYLAYNYYAAEWIVKFEITKFCKVAYDKYCHLAWWD